MAECKEEGTKRTLSAEAKREEKGREERKRERKEKWTKRERDSPDVKRRVVQESHGVLQFQG